MDPKLYKLAAKHSLEVYKKNISIGMDTQINYGIDYINDVRWQVISIAGTNGIFFDGLKNINILSWMGIKLSAYWAAGRINKYIKLEPDTPLMITGHSLGGAAAISYKKRYKKGFCVVFAPANCLRRHRSRKMKDTVVFMDPDDPVTQIFGRLSFGLPECETIKAPKDHKGYSFGDHGMLKWFKFVKKMCKI